MSFHLRTISTSGPLGCTTFLQHKSPLWKITATMFICPHVVSSSDIEECFDAGQFLTGFDVISQAVVVLRSSRLNITHCCGDEYCPSQFYTRRIVVISFSLTGTWHLRWNFSSCSLLRATLEFEPFFSSRLYLCWCPYTSCTVSVFQ